MIRERRVIRNGEPNEFALKQALQRACEGLERCRWAKGVDGPREVAESTLDSVYQMTGGSFGGCE